jgi:hypothetical protein
MTNRRIYAALFTILAFPFLRVAPAFAHGDKVVPQVADGVQDNGIKYRTKFDISNLSPFRNTTITMATVYFYRDNGAQWTVGIKDPVSGNPLNVSSYTLNLGFSQTVRLETLGTGDLAQGYAVIRNLETTTEYPDDRELGVTVYFEVLARNTQGNFDVIDTISVPITAPTVSWTFPVEIDTTFTTSANLLTGFAMVDVSGETNNISIDLYQTSNPLSGDAAVAAAPWGTQLGGNQKAVGFLNLADFFPTNTPTKFKGMAVASSTSPLVFISLLQTPMPLVNAGVQFTMLVPTNLDSLRRNSFMYLPQGYSLDADLMISDYYRDESFDQDLYYEIPWDLLFQSGATPGNVLTPDKRYLMPQGSTQLAVIGIKDYSLPDQFDAITLTNLRNLAYSGNFIELSDGNANLQQGFTFAIKTGLGRYAKVRIRNWVTYEGSDYVDLLLEIYVYR